MASANAGAKNAGPKLRCEGTMERALRARGFCAIAGVDEVGRGSLFGAVFAAAVILSPDRPIRGLNDSKQLEPDRRVVLAQRIREKNGKNGRYVSSPAEAVDAVTTVAQDGDMILTLGAGSVSQFGPQILEKLKQREPAEAAS